MTRPRVRATALVAVALALTACSQLEMAVAPLVNSWESEVMGLTVKYDVVDSTALGGMSYLVGSTCHVTVAYEMTLKPRRYALVAAHELAHCLDHAYLGSSHNDVGDLGCQWEEYFCSEEEGYAQAYALEYMATCGALSPLGIHPGDGVSCPLPDPRLVGKEGS